MFQSAEECMLDTRPTWHGTALGWLRHIDSKVTRIPKVDERFSGIKYCDADLEIIAFCAYITTAGNDDHFLDVLDKLSINITANIDTKSIILIGLDSNQSSKSSRRRTEGMDNFVKIFNLKSILPDDRPTFHSNYGQYYSQIDHILHFIPESANIKVTLEDFLCQLDNPSNLSTHDALIGTITLPTIKP